MSAEGDNAEKLSTTDIDTSRLRYVYSRSSYPRSREDVGRNPPIATTVVGFLFSASRSTVVASGQSIKLEGVNPLNPKYET